MSKVKPNVVTLVVPGHDMRRDFEIGHAERLLRAKNNGGWQLPINSEFEFDLNDGLKRKPTKRSAEKSEE